MEVREANSIYFIKNMYYDYMNRKPTYLLDSNILVDIEKLYYKPSKVDLKRIDSLKILLEEIRANKIPCEYNSALTELSANYATGGCIEEKLFKTKRAVKEILKMSPKKLDKHIKYSSKSYSNSIRMTEFGDMKSVIENTEPLLVYSYLPLAMFYRIKDNYNNNQKLQLFNKILDYMDKEMRMMELYGIAAISYYLFNNNVEFNNAQSLMKVNNNININKKAWNVSWDLSFLRYINIISAYCLAGKGKNENNYIFVTRDKALAGMSKYLTLGEFSMFENDIIPNIIIDESRIDKKYLKGYKKQYSKFMSEEKLNSRKKYLKNCKHQTEKLLKLID